MPAPAAFTRRQLMRLFGLATLTPSAIVSRVLGRDISPETPEPPPASPPIVRILLDMRMREKSNYTVDLEGLYLFPDGSTSWEVISCGETCPDGLDHSGSGAGPTLEIKLETADVIAIGPCGDPTAR